MQRVDTIRQKDLDLLDSQLAASCSLSSTDSSTASSIPGSPFASTTTSESEAATPPPELALPKAALTSRYAVDLIRREAEALTRLAERIEGDGVATDGFNAAMELICNMGPHSKLIVTGLGKSALVGRKAVATMCSLGLPAIFIDPIAALHGDIGVLSPHGIDVALMISYSGNTAELLRLLPSLQARCSGVIALTGDSNAKLSKAADCWLDGRIGGDGCEADVDVPAPTSSALVALAQLDALALCTLRLRVGWEAPGKARASVFAYNHAGGQLGIKLKTLD